MLELIMAGGWLMLPLLLCSLTAVTIVCERLWSLRTEKIRPRGLVPQILSRIKSQSGISGAHIQEIKKNSPLGRIIAIGMINIHQDKESLKLSLEEAGHQVVHELERYLGGLGTIATVSPLLGLLGTVIGMIKIFSAGAVMGSGNAGVLAGGIAQALITTAAGLTVAIPSLLFYRYFQRRVEDLAINMEQEASRFLDYARQLSTSGMRTPDNIAKG
jgi:biopolymer transport protein ExbB